MKTKAIFIAFIMFALIISAGCTDFNSDPTQTKQTTTSTENFGDLTFTKSPLVQHYRSDGSCYYRADTVDIINNGKKDALNVVVRCNLVDSSSGKIPDTMSRYFEIIRAGDHQAFDVELDGECGKSYNLEIKISKEEE